MTSARHRAGARSRARSIFRRFVTPTALAVAATTGVVAAGVAGVGAATGPSNDDVDLSRAGTSISQADANALESRKVRSNRSADRTLPSVTLKPQAVRQLWSTAPLNVWAGPREQAPKFRVVDFGTKLSVTGQRVGNWAEVLIDKRVRWVNATYLAKKKPRPETTSGAATSGVSMAPCPDGSATESGLSPDGIRLYRAACAAFPQLATYGGYAPRGEHSGGEAIDFMTPDPATGQALASWAQANASALNLSNVIYAQRIWTPVRASEGWRFMPDRGSPTANHMDHVHIMTN